MALLVSMLLGQSWQLCPLVFVEPVVADVVPGSRLCPVSSRGCVAVPRER